VGPFRITSVLVVTATESESDPDMEGNGPSVAESIRIKLSGKAKIGVEGCVDAALARHILESPRK